MSGAPARAALEPIAFVDLNGWAEADLAGAWRTCWRSADALVRGTSPLRAAVPADERLAKLAKHIADEPFDLGARAAHDRFERWFEPARIAPEAGNRGFLTGYYEPSVEGSLRPTAAFKAPVLARPSDLITFAAGETHVGVPPTHAAGRLGPDGMEPYADRASIEAGALRGEGRPLVWLRDWTEVFLIHVQGSARVTMPDGTALRLVYAGRNGHPYTSIGKILIEEGAIAQNAMTLDALKGWLRAAGQEPGEPGRRLMQRNRSYIFFRAEPATDDGPTGGAGLPLTPGCSIAIDRTIWPYGLPFWIEADRPVAGFGLDPLARLFVGQDTGSAILGPARADLFLGSGEVAGRNAGLVRHAARFTVLLPRSS